MSGVSGCENCPRCRGKDTLYTYSDWIPFDMGAGVCVRCGFSYYTQTEILDDDLLEERRAEMDYKGKLTKEDKEHCDDFDRNSGWIVRRE